MKFALVASYQYRENYGAHDWNGEGECPQYWKCKGSHEVVVRDDLTTEEVVQLGAAGLRQLVEQSEYGFYYGDNYVQFTNCDYELVELPRKELA